MRFEDLNLPDVKELAGVVKRNDENNGVVEGQMLSIGIRSTVITHRGHSFVISINYRYPAFSEDYAKYGSYVCNLNVHKDFEYIKPLFNTTIADFVTNYGSFITINENIDASEEYFNYLIEHGKKCIDIYLDEVFPHVCESFDNYRDLICKASNFYDEQIEKSNEIKSICKKVL